MKRQDAFADVCLVCASGLPGPPCLPPLSLTLSAACAVLSSWRVSSRLALAPCRDLLRPAMSPSLVRTTCRGGDTERRTGGVRPAQPSSSSARRPSPVFSQHSNRLIVLIKSKPPVQGAAQAFHATGRQSQHPGTPCWTCRHAQSLLVEGPHLLWLAHVCMGHAHPIAAHSILEA